jgi:hypothetical protein
MTEQRLRPALFQFDNPLVSRPRRMSGMQAAAAASEHCTETPLSAVLSAVFFHERNPHAGILFELVDLFRVQFVPDTAGDHGVPLRRSSNGGLTTKHRATFHFLWK